MKGLVILMKWISNLLKAAANAAANPPTIRIEGRRYPTRVVPVPVRIPVRK